ncbi:glycosyltransferase involved in cell wall biosynthesis [Actinocorallia herbida]|uniref:Glycosyltransferase involved in cell wall biosynthesis n=1 Tax=Actinocorallia herbida TaxID=58109 RepID=A0A3N1DBU4_9ACTN|nr:glycosyltransferase family 4 protein [Actinocorallia herbida]ROO90994.1 glycosyltransferase involved in cell wall biosynthesis [Actinocorallia herbida]
MSDCFLPRLGGIEVQVDELAAAQRADGHEVAVVTATPGPDFAGLLRVGPRVPWGLPVGGSLRPVLEELKPDVLHIHAGVVSPFAWRALATCRDVPAVVTVHSLWGRPTGLAYRRLIGPDVAVTAVSEAAARPIRRALGADVRVVPNGIDTAPWRAIRPWLPTGAVHVVAVGRLAPRKEPFTLLKVLREAGRRVPIRATIVGDGPAARGVRRFLREHRMAHWVRVTGRLDRSEVREVLASADVFVAPARRESFGLAALEARLAGVPVIAHAGSGVADFVAPEREGLLAGSVKELTEALIRLTTDHELRHRIAAHNGATVPERCTWPAVLAAFDALYESRRAAAPTNRPEHARMPEQDYAAHSAVPADRPEDARVPGPQEPDLDEVVPPGVPRTGRPEDGEGPPAPGGRGPQTPSTDRAHL